MQGSHTMGSPCTANPGHIPIPPSSGPAHLGAVGVALHHGEAVVVGGGVAEDVHNRAHPLDPPQTGDGSAHDLPAGKSRGGNNSAAARPELTPPHTQHLPAPPITSGGCGGGRHAAGEGAGDHQAPVTTAGHRHPSRLGPTTQSEGWWWPPAHLPGREGVGRHRGLPVQERHALQLDVHVIQPLQGEPSCQQRPAGMLRGCSQAAAPL